MTGRPSEFSPEIASAICERLIEGESLRRICRDEDMPSASMVCRWLSQNEEFREQYAHAREAQADTLADEVIDIADGGVGEFTDPAIAAQLAARDRLRVDARKWYASRLAPKKYGDRHTLEHTDSEGKNPFAPLMELVAANGRPRPGS